MSSLYSFKEIPKADNDMQKLSCRYTPVSLMRCSKPHIHPLLHLTFLKIFKQLMKSKFFLKKFMASGHKSVPPGSLVAVFIIPCLPTSKYIRIPVPLLDMLLVFLDTLEYYFSYSILNPHFLFKLRFHIIEHIC